MTAVFRFFAFYILPHKHLQKKNRTTPPVYEGDYEEATSFESKRSTTKLFFFADVIIIAKPVIDHADGSVENTSTTDCIQRN